jgi:hypothetical protein
MYVRRMRQCWGSGAFLTPGSGIGFFRIQDLGWIKVRIRDKHPGSATLVCEFMNRIVLLQMIQIFM